MADLFTIDGVEFELSPLKVEKSLALLPDLFSLFAPLLNSGGELTPERVRGIIEGGSAGLKNLPNFVAAFQAQCKVRRDKQGKATSGDGSMVSMVGQIFDQTFERKMKLQLKWLVKCLQLEYADFLAEGGLNDLLSLVEKSSSPNE